MKTDQEIIEKIEELGGIYGPAASILTLVQFLPAEKGRVYICSDNVKRNMFFDIEKNREAILAGMEEATQVLIQGLCTEKISEVQDAMDMLNALLWMLEEE